MPTVLFATVHAIAHDEPHSLALLRPDLDSSLVSAVEQAMHKDPRQRFETAAEMANAIGIADVYATASTDETVPIGDGQRTAILPPILPSQRPRRSEASTPIGSRSRRAAIAIAAVLLVIAVILTGWAATRGSNANDPINTTDKPIACRHTSRFDAPNHIPADDGQTRSIQGKGKRQRKGTEVTSERADHSYRLRFSDVKDQTAGASANDDALDQLPEHGGST